MPQNLSYDKVTLLLQPFMLECEKGQYQFNV